MNSLVLKKANIWLRSQLLADQAYLIPLRLFIGIGWVRAGLEKFIEAGWPQGTALTDFFNQQLTGSTVAFPFYRDLIQQVFTPNSLGLSWLIIIGQLLVGTAIITGTFTNFALLCALFMNLNFILAGQVNPSAFYVVIQVALLMSNSGYILGADRMLSRIIPIGLLVAQPLSTRKFWRLEKALYLIAALVALSAALVDLPFIRDFGPRSVDDPAMILLILALITSFSAFVTSFQFTGDERVVPSAQLEFHELTRRRRSEAG